ncbi:hypothetical protein [Inediibacterium massiliense]|uniref:hypothetical protein n=1 Tax=Inediibacterium massiliense TaxID=1658111 RepID=UPI0006B69B17|nr:hypothetical protein [Inediibacterium massiliense]
MFKKLITYVLLSVLLFLSFIFYQFLYQNEYVSTFKTYVIPNLKISSSLIDEYKSSEESLHKQAKESIILTTLKNLNYDQWIKYIEYMDINLYEENIIPNDENELIISLNLSKDLSVIAIYRLIGNEYVFTNKVENLVPLESIEFMPIKDLGYNLMITHQLLDERFGAFFVEQFIEIFLYLDDEFKSIFKKTKYSDEIYASKWIDKKAPSDEWIQIIENNQIDIIQKEYPVISVSIHRQKGKAIKNKFPSPSDFKPIESIVTKETYYYSSKYKNFILGEGTIQHSSKPIAIIEDTNHWIESFLGFSSNNYKVLTEQGEILFIHKDLITLRP